MIKKITQKHIFNQKVRKLTKGNLKHPKGANIPKGRKT